MTDFRAGVIGSPISHSLSPVIHRAAYAALELPWRYDAIDISEGEFDRFIDELGSEWFGLSVTMPLKERAFARSVATEDFAKRTKVVNTLLRRDGSWHGANTDVPGIAAVLKSAGVDRPTSLTIIGSGATARSALIAVEGMTDSINVVARSSEKASLLRDFTSTPVSICAWNDSSALSADVVISTAPSSAVEAFNAPGTPGLLFDVIYSPWPTPFASSWSVAGGAVLSGLELLIRQAALQIELFTGEDVPEIVVDAMRAAGESALQ
jgi:shikimate dehydrogenase